jgi:hypothetical protein
MNRNNSIHWSIHGMLLCSFILLPHQAVLHYFFPAEIIGKNIWLILPLICALCGFLAVILFSLEDWSRRYMIASILIWCTGVLSAMHWPQANLAEILINTRPLFFLPLVLIASIILTRYIGLHRFILYVISAQALLQAVIGLLHVHFFPQFVTGTFAHLRGVAYFTVEDWGPYTSREAGTMGNPSAYAQIIVLGAFATAQLFVSKWQQRQSSSNDWWLICGVSLILYVAAIPSLNRLSLLFLAAPPLILLLGHLLRSGVRLNKGILAIAGLAILIILTFVFISYSQLWDRFFLEGLAPRTQKNELIFSVLTSNFNFLMYGVPAELVRSLRTPEGWGVGDNCFLQLAAAAGIPIFCAWLFLIVRIMQRIFHEQINGATSAMLWWALLCYATLLLYLDGSLFNDGWVMSVGILLTMSSARITASRIDLNVQAKEDVSPVNMPMYTIERYI